MARWLLGLLAAAGAVAGEGADELLARLASGDAEARLQAVLELRATAPGREDVVAGTAALLKHQSVAVRIDAASLLEPLLIGSGQGLLGRAERRAKPGKLVSKLSEAAVEQALKWLASVQDRVGKGGDGRWACAGFTKHDPGGKLDGAGSPVYDAGITGLVLLAFLGAGYTDRTGPYPENVAEGLLYLRSAQAKDGCIGPRGDPRIVTIHAVATLALAEAWILTGDAGHRAAAQAAVAYLERQQDGLGWGYAQRIDTHTVGWALFALGVGRLGGLDVDPARTTWGLQWLDQRTDQRFGPIGYDAECEDGAVYAWEEGPTFNGIKMPGLYSATGARGGILLDRETWPEVRVAPMTSLGAWCQILLTQDDLFTKQIVRAREWAACHRPLWEYDELYKSHAAVDFGYWAYGALLMAARDARSRDPNPTAEWFAALHQALLPNQRTAGAAAGSWDPVDAWGAVAGRVHATALAVRALEAPYLFEDRLHNPKRRPKAHVAAFAELAKVAKDDPDTAVRARAAEVIKRIKAVAPYK
jgi:hypothetical protein